MKKLLSFFLLIPFFTHAQKKPLIAEGISPGLYITHKVAPKENFYSIGRIYNISPREIAPFNNLELESGLNPGQILRVPLNVSNFFQSGIADPDETFVPLHHVVSNKEGLYRIAVNYNDLPLLTLKQWNNIKGDAVKKGTKLIVGYLKVKKGLSNLAINGIGNVINAKEVTSANTTKPGTNKAEMEKKGSVNSKTDERVPVKQENQVAKPDSGSFEPVKSNKGKNIVGGVFKEIYDAQVNNTEKVESEGTAGTFKSTSGWSDKKYYCLYNSALQGTIVKITNPVNGKFVFAKVLDLMPDIKQNDGLLICISNASAEELGATDGNFNCLITYSK